MTTNNTNEVQRSVVKLGLDFRPIPVDLGDGVEWGFSPDPSPEQWSVLMDSLKVFQEMGDGDFGGESFLKALSGLTKAMSDLIVDEDQRKKWIDRNYGLGPQQAISEALMGIWTGFPTKRPSRSGKASGRTG